MTDLQSFQLTISYGLTMGMFAAIVIVDVYFMITSIIEKVRRRKEAGKHEIE